MTIAIVLEHLDPLRGGAETSALQLARELSLLGHDVTLVVRRDTLNADAARSLAQDAEAGVQVAALGVSGLSRAARSCAFLRAAARICLGGRFDVVHSLLPLAGCDVYQPRGGTFAATIHHSTLMLPQPWRSLRRGLKRLNRRQQRLAALERGLLTGDDVPHVACVSNFVRRQVLELAPELPAERAVMIRNGVSIEPLSETDAAAARRAWRQRLGIEEHAPVLLFCAHNLRLKGFYELRAALRQRRGEATWHLIVAGRSRPRDSHGGQPPPAGDGGQSPPTGNTRIHFIGPQRDMPALYAAADALVHPTWYDPCSRVVLEALCCGLPVVTTAFDGAAEVVADGRDGRVIDRPDDLDALRDAMAQVLEPSVRHDARQQAAQRREALSMQRHAQQLVVLYQTILAEQA